MEFTPITTQEEFDAAISKRLKRERETISAQYADYEDLKQKVTDYEGQIGTLTKDAENLRAQIKGHETNSVKMRIAHETGIPYEMAMRLTGETEKDIRADAETMAKFIRKSEPAPGRKSSEPTGKDTETAAFKQMLQSMKGE